MINERLRKRLRKDRLSTMITVRIPADILESLESTASARGFNSYQTLLKSYISDGLRQDETEVVPQTDRGHPKDMTGTVRTRRNPHFGSSFDAYLKKEGVYEETQTTAIRRVLASHIAQVIKTKGLTKTQMARQMRTSPAQLGLVLDPDNARVTLATLHRAALVVGRKLRVELV